MPRATRSRSLRLHVVWHARLDAGAEYARSIYDWFRGDPGDLARCGTGIPVEYHVGDADGVEWTDFAPDCLHVVVLLVDDGFVLERALRAAVRSLGGRGNVVLVPVALHPAAFDLDGPMASRNFLRIDLASEVPGPASVERRCGRLRRLLTHLVARMVARTDAGTHAAGFAPFDPHEPPRKLSIFVSHAKFDGRDEAARLRMAILAHGQLDAFFDESDIAVGSDWERALNDAAKRGSGAMLVLLTSAYASRRWCVRELRMARRPQRVAPGVYSVVPVRALDALSGAESPLLAELAGVPIQRPGGGADGGDAVIDALVRDVVLQAYWAELADRFRRAHEGPAPFVALTCVPDARLIAEVFAAEGLMPSRRCRFAFAGTAVAEETVGDWQRLFPRAEFVALESLETGS